MEFCTASKKGVVIMLSLGLKQGEYLTIGDNVVVQLDRITGDRCKLVIEAPRQIPVVRGTVLEREGGQRPECVFNAPRWHKREISWDRSKAQALSAMRTLLYKMEDRNSDVQALRRQLNHMFPPTQSEKEISSPKGCPEPKPSEAGSVRRGEAAK